MAPAPPADESYDEQMARLTLGMQKLQMENLGHVASGSNAAGAHISATLRTKQSPQHLGFGLAILLCIFTIGWLDGLGRSQDTCTTPGACDAISIMGSMGFAMLKMWVLVLLSMLVLYCIELVVVGVIIKPMEIGLPGFGPIDAVLAVASYAMNYGKESDREMIGMQVMFAWLLSPNVLLAMLGSLALTTGFSVIYISWLKLRDSTEEEYAAVVWNIYMFQLVCFIAAIVCEFWLLEWWKK